MSDRESREVDPGAAKLLRDGPGDEVAGGEAKIGAKGVDGNRTADVQTLQGCGPCVLGPRIDCVCAYVSA